MSGLPFGGKKPVKEHIEIEYKRIFECTAGEVVFDDLKKFCGWEDEIEGKDTLDTYKNIGKREVFRYILKMLGKLNHGTTE